nr:YfhO family protein [Myxococcus sp. MH1]
MTDESKQAAVPSGRAWVVFAGMVVVALGFFARAAFSSDVFIAGDTLRAFYPMRAFWAERVSTFDLPEWYAYDGFGQSFLGIFLSGAFHPTSLFHLVLPLGAAVKLTVLSCYPVAMLGVWALLREYGVPRPGALFGACCFAFSGYLVCITNNPTYLLAASTVPAALWGAVRFLRAPSARRLAVGAGLLALVAFAGDAQGFAMTNALVVLVALVDPEAGGWRRRVTTCAALVVTGALLSAPQLFPAAGLVLSGEPGARSVVEAQRFSLHPLRLGELLMGPYLADKHGLRGVPDVVVWNLVPSGGFGRVWVDSIYVGTPACVLALAGLWACARRPRAWVLAGAWVLLLALCLGDSLPLYGWVYQVLPLWRPFRYPEKLVPLVTLGLAVAAGLGWKHCLVEDGTRRAVVGAGLVLGALGGVVALGEAAGGWWTRGVLTPRWPEVPPVVVGGLSGNVVWAGAVTAVLALACAALAWPWGAARLRAGLFVALELGALVWAHEPLYVLAPAELLELSPPFADRIRERVPAGEPVRVGSSVRAIGNARAVPGLDHHGRLSLGFTTGLLPDTATLWGLESANGYMPGESVRVRGLRRDVSRWYGELAPRLGTPFSVHSTRAGSGVVLPPTVRVLAEDPLFETKLVEHPEALARVLLARPRCVAGKDEALGLLLTGPLPPRDVAVVECAGGPLPEASERLTGTVRVERPSPEHLLAEVEASEPAVLVINDAWQPGWTAWVDGRETAILPANVAVRAVAVPAGQHQVELRYRTPGLRLGLLVALGTLLAWVLLERMGRHATGKATT